MKKVQLAAGALALTLLAGCSTGDPDDIAYLSANISRDKEIITVDGQGITAEAYLFWLVNAISSQRLYYGELQNDEDWEAVNEDGISASDQVKADALETAKLWRVMENKAQEMGVVLTQEQEDEIIATMDQAIESVGGEEAFQVRLDQMCISREGFLHLNRVYYLNQGVREKLEESGALTVTADDVDTYLEENGIYAAKHILIATRHISEDGKSYEEYSDEERAQAAQLVQDLRDQLAQSGDSEALFDELMNEYSEDSRDSSGNLYYPEGYTYIYPNQMVSEFEEGALALEIGQISQPIQTDYGYHIILRTEVDRTQAEADCDADYKYNQITLQWLDEAEVKTTKAYDNLDPKTFYEQFRDILSARSAAREAQASEVPEESPAETPQDSSSPEP